MNAPQILRILLLAPALSLAASPAVLAQAAANGEGMAAFARDLARRDANAEGALASGQPEVSMEATEEGGIVAAILGFKFNNDLNSIIIRVAGPLNKDTGDTELVNLSDLPGGTEAKLRFSHASSKVEKWLPSANLTTVCLNINRLLASQSPSPPEEVTDLLDELDTKSGKERFEAYQKFWPEFRLHVIDKIPSKIPPPQWEEIQGRAVAKLCGEWNSGRVEDLLLDKVMQNQKQGDEKTIENPDLARRSEPCNLKNLLCSRTKQARALATDKLPDLDKVKETAGEAKKQKEAIAQADFEAAAREADNLRARAVSADAVEALLASARVERDRALREAQRAFDETVDAAKATIANAAQQAASTEEKAVYDALTAQVVKEIDSRTGLDVPFIRKPPQTAGKVQIQCNDNDIEAKKLLASLRPEERGAVFRELRAAAPSLLFFTGEAKVSSQDFKYIADPLALNPNNQLVATKTDREYNHAGHLGASLLWRGALTSLGYTRNGEWSAKPSAQFCFPRGDGGGLVCTSTASGPPAKESTSVYDLQFKYAWSQAFAFQGQVFYADKTDILNPHLLAYFLPQAGRLQGGLDFSYLSNDPDGNDGFNLRLFVGVPFSLDD